MLAGLAQARLRGGVGVGLEVHEGGVDVDVRDLQVRRLVVGAPDEGLAVDPQGPLRILTRGRRPRWAPKKAGAGDVECLRRTLLEAGGDPKILNP